MQPLNAVPFFETSDSPARRFCPTTQLSRCLLHLAGLYGTACPGHKVKGESHGLHIQRALELAPDLTETLINLAHIKTFVEWDWEGLKEVVNSLLKLAPGKAEIYIPISTYYGIIGNLEAYEGYCAQGLQLDPVSVPYRLHYSLVLIRRQKFEEAQRHLDQVLQYLPGERLALECKGWLHLYQQEFDQALLLFEQIESEYGYRRLKSANLACAYALKGDRNAAQPYLEAVVQHNDQAYGAFSYDLAMVWAAFGETDKVFEALEKAIELRLGEVSLFHLEPIFQPLKTDSRFELCEARIRKG